MLSLLLSPAVNLMNRLNYRYKFSLINVLFLIPLFGLGYLQLQEFALEQQATEVEIQGLSALKETLSLIETAAEMRDLYVVQGNQPILQKRIDQQRARFFQKLDAVEVAVAPIDGFAGLDAMIVPLHQLAAPSSAAPSPDLGSVFDQQNQLVLESWNLARSLSYQAGLYQDKDFQNFLLMKLVLDSMESLLEHQGQLRSYSTKVVKSGVINSVMMEMLNRLLDDLVNDQKRLATNLRPLLSAENAYSPTLISRAKAIPQQLAHSTDRLENELLLENKIDHEWLQYLEQESASSTVIYAFVNDALAFVEQRLQQRYIAHSNRFYALLIGLLVVFLVSNYLMLGFSMSVRRSIRAILACAERISKGDLTTQVSITNTDELGQIASKFNLMTQKMRELLVQVTTTVESVASQAEIVEGIAQQSSAAVEQQHQETELVATAINKLSSSAQQVADMTLTASQQSSEVDSKAVQGQKLVQTTLSDIDQLSRDIDCSRQATHRLVRDSDSITQVLDVIKGVAEQTNLLALNAAIEAARAGEQGRGFAVVANEVRTLAQRTQQSTAEIEKMVHSLQAGVNDAVEAMEVSHDKVGQTVTGASEVSHTLEQISQAISHIVDFNSQIASAGETQTIVATEIELNVQTISTAGNQTAAGAKETEAACQQMAQQTEQLLKIVSTFRL